MCPIHIWYSYMVHIRCGTHTGYSYMIHIAYSYIVHRVLVHPTTHVETTKHHLHLIRPAWKDGLEILTSLISRLTITVFWTSLKLTLQKKARQSSRHITWIILCFVWVPHNKKIWWLKALKRVKDNFCNGMQQEAATYLSKPPGQKVRIQALKMV